MWDSPRLEYRTLYSNEDNTLVVVESRLTSCLCFIFGMISIIQETFPWGGILVHVHTLCIFKFNYLLDCYFPLTIFMYVQIVTSVKHSATFNLH